MRACLLMLTLHLLLGVSDADAVNAGPGVVLLVWCCWSWSWGVVHPLPALRRSLALGARIALLGPRARGARAGLPTRGRAGGRGGGCRRRGLARRPLPHMALARPEHPLAPPRCRARVPPA
eukprot:2600875-Rhodomonas_salina.1